MSDDEIYELLGQVFEWNKMKAARNAINHGVRFTEAATVFFDRGALFQPDEVHSLDEQRYTVLGRSIHLRELLVVHVLRGDTIRIISARRAEPRERRDYESRLGKRL